ncbi:helix-turn-helix domain-containing protein [Ensifer soli]|uniref:helix-turn-helix domain-containing protein n=1 Tax=Ciceribacter sp. sgz301302 TaxID=3342379 RepID=UPI0035B8207D
MNHANDNALADDILKGAEEIARFLGMDRRAIYFAVSKGRLPTFRIGTSVFARKSTLSAWIVQQESAATRTA